MFNINYLKLLLIISIAQSTFTCTLIQKTKILLKSSKYISLYSLIINMLFSIIFSITFTTIKFPNCLWIGLFSYLGADTLYKSLEGKKVIQVFTQANPGDAFDTYIKSLETMPFAYMGMEVIDTIIAKGAAGKGEGIEDALKKIEELEI